MRLRLTLLALGAGAGLGLFGPAAGAATCHDGSFTPDHILRVKAQDIYLNCEKRYSTAVNGSVPGPVLRIPAGKTSWIRVYNDDPAQNLTMHWHGLAEAMAPLSDGTPAVSQWPIPPLYYYDYELSPERPGTFFYHSHVDFQAGTAYGALIVEEAKGTPRPYHWDDELVFVSGDYFNKTDDVLIAGLEANPFTWTGEVIGVLVNGKGTNKTHNDKIPGCGFEQFNIRHDKTYRLRFIGATALSFLSLKVQSHKLTVIEADGYYTKPRDVDYIQFGSGQRYSVLLKAKTPWEIAVDRFRGIQSYAIQFQTLARPAVYLSYASLNYKGLTKPLLDAPAKPPLVLPDVTNGFLDDLASLDSPVPPTSEVDRTIVLDVISLNRSLTTGNLAATPQYVWAVDENTTWTEQYPSKPYLVALYENDTSRLPDYDYALAHNNFDERVRAFPAKIGETLDIILQVRGLGGTQTPDVHPFHAHGKHFWNLGSGNGSWPGAAANDARLKQQGISPAVRDSTFLFRPWLNAPREAAAGWRAWRLRVDQPGVWMIHCHTLAHMIMGMQSVWVFGDAKDIRTVDEPDVSGYLTYGGAAFGNATHAACPMHYFDL